MKKTYVVISLSVIALAVVVSGYSLLSKRIKKTTPQNLPQQIRVKLPTGEEVTAYRIPPVAHTAPTGARIIVSGKVTKEKDDLGSVQMVIQSEVGTKYILLNTPYMMRIEKNGLGKKVKLKGVTIAKTTFKNYPALYIEDIIEIRK
ncbi:MAG: hypothetical protein NT145_03145 [Elusimicrobia bacterium]|nr:hypothetical protein [Elusimicrobiota bacterium]